MVTSKYLFRCTQRCFERRVLPDFLCNCVVMAVCLRYDPADLSEPDVSAEFSKLSRIPDGAKPLASLAIRSLIMVCLVVLHGVGLYYVLRANLRAERGLLDGPPHVLGAMFLFGWSVFLMMALHVAEILAWAFSLINLGLIARVHDAIYFCANSYTTLGYATVALEPQWRSIAPVIAISGLFAFALTAKRAGGCCEKSACADRPH